MAWFVLACFTNHSSPSALNQLYARWQNPTEHPIKFKLNEPNYGLSPLRVRAKSDCVQSRRDCLSHPRLRGTSYPG